MDSYRQFVLYWLRVYTITCWTHSAQGTHISVSKQDTASFVHNMACCLIGAQPLSELMFAYWYLIPKNKIRWSAWLNYEPTQEPPFRKLHEKSSLAIFNTPSCCENICLRNEPRCFHWCFNWYLIFKKMQCYYSILKRSGLINRANI